MNLQFPVCLNGQQKRNNDKSFGRLCGCQNHVCLRLYCSKCRNRRNKKWSVTCHIRQSLHWIVSWSTPNEFRHFCSIGGFCLLRCQHVPWRASTLRMNNLPIYSCLAIVTYNLPWLIFTRVPLKLRGPLTIFSICACHSGAFAWAKLCKKQYRTTFHKTNLCRQHGWCFMGL